MTGENSGTQSGATQQARTVLPYGAEIHFNDERDAHVPDRVEFLPGGFVKGIFKRQYDIHIYHPDDIDSIHTHTEHLEDEEWW